MESDAPDVGLGDTLGKRRAHYYIESHDEDHEGEIFVTVKIRKHGAQNLSFSLFEGQEVGQ